MSAPRRISPADFADFDDYVAAVKHEAERRVIAAKNKLHARKGQPLLDPDTGRAPLQIVAPVAKPSAPPDVAPEEWRVGAHAARVYKALMASNSAGLPIDEIGRVAYLGHAYRRSTLSVHISTLRSRAAMFGVVVPPLRDGMIARPYMRGARP